MHFIDDEDLCAVSDRADAEMIEDHVTDVLNAGVAGGIDFDDVHVAPSGNFDARIALAARLHRGTVDAVKAPGQDARGRGFPDAARAGEDERLRDPLGGNRVAQRLRDPALADDVIEPLRPPLPRQDLVGQC